MQYDYSIVIPTYNRMKTLECCLFCLTRQDFQGMFEVIIADDGSSDSTLDLVKGFNEVGLNIKYVWQPDKGNRTGHARNKGVAISKSDNIIFLDSDVIVRENWLSEYSRILKKNRGIIINGRYDFLLPMIYTVSDVIDNFDLVVNNRLKIEKVIFGYPYGEDIRGVIFKKGEVVTSDGGPLLTGNVLVPKKAFENVGGFDENIIGHGGEDADLGLALKKAGYRFLYSEKIMAWHLHHERNQAENLKSLWKHVDYIEKKFGKGKYAKKKKNEDKN